MTEQDYIAMAKDYEFQVEVITNKLNKLENQMANKELRGVERKNAVSQYELLQEMRLECSCTARKLRKIANRIAAQNSKI